MSNSLSDANVEAIQESVKTEVLTVGGEEFVTRPVYRVPLEKEPERYGMIKLATLSSLVAYVNSVDHLDKDGLIVLVEDAETVKVFTQNGDGKMEGKRFCWAGAEAELPDMRYGDFVSVEEMIIRLNSRFVHDADDDREALVKMIGNIVAEEAITQGDDGFSQNVVVQAGIQRSSVALPNPCSLTPFRTFVELTQPTGEFLVRTQKRNDAVQVAIFEADGGAWKNDARETIKDYLTENLPGVIVLA